MPRNATDLTRGEWCVLALIEEGTAYGWALSRAFAPGGEIHQYWSGDRQRVYRSMRSLEARGLIEPTRIESGERGRRTVFAVTSDGRGRLRHWLSEPATNVKDVHNAFLLKFAFAQRAGLDTRKLVADQRDELLRMIERLDQEVADAGHHEELPLRLLADTTRAVLAFVDELIDDPAAVIPARPPIRPPRASVVSDLTGREIDDREDTVTLIASYSDPAQRALVVIAHRDDPLVEQIEHVGRPLDAVAADAHAHA